MHVEFEAPERDIVEYETDPESESNTTLRPGAIPTGTYFIICTCNYAQRGPKSFNVLVGIAGTCKLVGFREWRRSGHDRNEISKKFFLTRE